jgi:predicted transcriptional regulator
MGQTKQTLDQFSVYIPQRKLGDRIVERVITLGDSRQRSVNFICVQAIEEYLERQEAA